MILTLKNIVLSCGISFLCSFCLCAKDFAAGLDAFSAKDYAASSEMFLKVINNEPNNSSAYYNLGIVRMEQAKFGEAIWAFEKVLKLTPNDSQSKEKIELCYAELGKPGYWKPHLNSVKSGLYSWSSDVWSLLSIAFSLLLCISIIVFKKSNRMSLRRLMIVFGMIGACFMFFSIVLASQVKSFSQEKHHAVVTRKSIPTFLEKGKKAKTVLEEGIQLSISNAGTAEYIVVTDNSGQEHLVRLADLSLF